MERPSSPRVGAVITNWRTPESTVRAARALLEDGVEDLVIVDNASDDGSAEQIEKDFPDRVLRLTENVGYGEACNLGAARLVDSDVLLFVNSDAYLHREGSVGALAKALDRPGVALAVPLLLNEDLSVQRSVVPFRTPLAAAVQASGLSRLLPNALQPRLGTYWEHAESRSVQSATGAVIAATATTWRALGGFQPVAAMYGEDHDLCWRAHKSIGATWFTAEAEFVHLGGKSTSGAYTTAARARKIAESEAAVIRRHLSPFRAELTVAILRGGHLGRTLVFRAFGHSESADLHRGLAAGFAKRVSERTQDSTDR